MHVFMDYFFNSRRESLSEDEEDDLLSLISESSPYETKGFADEAYWDDWVELANAALHINMSVWLTGEYVFISTDQALELATKFVESYMTMFGFDGLQSIVATLKHMDLNCADGDKDAKAWLVISAAVARGAMNISEVDL
jgi:hypothetical protein